MGCDRFGNTATSMRLLARPLYSVPADVALHSIAREEPFLGLFQWPPVAEHFEQLCGEHDIAIFAPFTLFDSDDHSLTVAIRDLHANRLRDAPSASRARRKDHA